MNCDLCGTPVKVVGHTTKHYEPDLPTLEELEKIATKELLGASVVRLLGKYRIKLLAKAIHERLKGGERWHK